MFNNQYLQKTTFRETLQQNQEIVSVTSFVYFSKKVPLVANQILSEDI